MWTRQELRPVPESHRKQSQLVYLALTRFMAAVARQATSHMVSVSPFLGLWLQMNTGGLGLAVQQCGVVKGVVKRCSVK